MNATDGRRQERPVTPWGTIVLRCAAAYNLLWGAAVVLFPEWTLARFNFPPQPTPVLWQCIGMIVGVYGIGYWLAAADPRRHWPLVLVGLLGKILGPIGFLDAAIHGRLPWSTGWTIVSNDLVWWFPFAAILISVWRSAKSMHRGLAVEGHLSQENDRSFTESSLCGVNAAHTGGPEATIETVRHTEIGRVFQKTTASAPHLGGSERQGVSGSS